jgi:hypothetical protein
VLQVITSDPDDDEHYSAHARSFYESYSKDELPPRSNGPWDSLRLMKHW